MSNKGVHHLLNRETNYFEPQSPIGICASFGLSLKHITPLLEKAGGALSSSFPFTAEANEISSDLFRWGVPLSLGSSAWSSLDALRPHRYPTLV